MGVLGCPSTVVVFVGQVDEPVGMYDVSDWSVNSFAYPQVVVFVPDQAFDVTSSCVRTPLGL